MEIIRLGDNYKFHCVAVLQIICYHNLKPGNVAIVTQLLVPPISHTKYVLCFYSNSWMLNSRNVLI